MKKQLMTGLFTVLALTAGAQNLPRMAQPGNKCGKPCADAHELLCF